jgi:hypothetical protein
MVLRALLFYSSVYSLFLVIHTFIHGAWMME